MIVWRHFFFFFFFFLRGGRGLWAYGDGYCGSGGIGGRGEIYRDACGLLFPASRDVIPYLYILPILLKMGS